MAQSSTPFDPNDVFAPDPERAARHRAITEEMLRAVAEGARRGAAWDYSELQWVAESVFKALSEDPAADWQVYSLAMLRLVRDGRGEGNQESDRADAYQYFCRALGLDGAALIFPEASR